MKLVLTCEHAGNYVPEKYQEYFYQNKILKTHRGYDLGAFDLFSFLEPIADFTKFNKISRLLIEVNRSQSHKNLFSEFSKSLSEEKKKELITAIYLPYRDSIEQEIQKFLDNNEIVLHLSVHSFTPILNGNIRNTEIGLLYDPSRMEEKKFCHKFKTNILKKNPVLKIRFNYPYLGKADGFTTYLRKKFQKNYIGIELEVNQKFIKDNKMPESLKEDIFGALKNAIK